MSKMKKEFKTHGYQMLGTKGRVLIEQSTTGKMIGIRIDLHEETQFMTKDLELFAVNILKALKSKKLKP